MLPIALCALSVLLAIVKIIVSLGKKELFFLFVKELDFSL